MFALSAIVDDCSSAGQVGLSGSGKTSLVSLILRFYDLDSGSISLGNHNISTLDPSYLRSCVATVPQEPALFSVSMHDNIAYGLPDVSRAEVETAATLANAHKFISAMPDGFDTVAGRIIAVTSIAVYSHPERFWLC